MKFMLKTDLINKLVYYHKHIKILQKYYVFHKGKKYWKNLEGSKNKYF